MSESSSVLNANSVGGAELSTFSSEVDQMVIWYRVWHPPCGIRRRAAVQITHGIAEYSARYDRLARFLAALGCAVYALDLRGHGQTAGPERLGQLGVTAWDDMTADIKQLADIAHAENPDLPLIAFGHSMGSALTQSHIENHADLLAGAVLCGTLGAVPGLAEEAYPQVIAQLEALATGPDAMAPSGFFGSTLAEFNAPFVADGATPTGSEWQTCDSVEISAFQSDPLCGKPFSNAMTYSVIKGFHSLWEPEKESRIPVDLPILIIAGSDDPVGGRTATIQSLISRYMAEGHRRLQYRFYAGGRHEILNEPEKDRVHRDIGYWLDAVLQSP
ncbi:lysophospholipase [Mycobacteroides abscessus]|uniref:alpha/beta fold hydrolase n=2 Tax=Mycobacteroides abscessus TaxID=36809 RepID=UPI0005E07060|nr:alpha/beta fold hydrolase [Mycobacteroides abscessus]CPU47304.1 lysophospholipase [Mycobacteroides abscessus]CPX16147.1 lysophospholipase [Mycobacteroides abscessus]SHR44391.1 lysophospholipase [Mycobacteroides abscessus subsp. abscessus]